MKNNESVCPHFKRFSTLTEIIAGHFDISGSEVAPSCDFMRDFNADYDDIDAIKDQIEDEFNIVIPGGYVDEVFTTVGNVLDHIEKAQRNQIN